MNFSIGEKVTFLAETGYGIITGFDKNDIVIVEDETGFDRPFLSSQLVKIASENYGENFHSDKDEDDQVYSTKHSVKQERVGDSYEKQDFWEIDLHLHEIIEDEYGLSDTQKLKRQVAEFKSFYKKARAKFIRKIVAIHGVGEGVLKHEIRTYLETQEHLEFYDADFREYGKGATAVELFYK